MLIKSIKLHNIRSYEGAEIQFPAGSVLLAGDIGSGKSTILLAIEFAIFGAKKGELPAYTLLRHGKKEGSVELKMGIDEKEIIIKRTLKKSNEDIKQEAGYIISNGIKKEATAEELRAIILDIMGYPKELVKKGKDFIYRYTVYTPQEEMKQILYESKDARLDTLRKVFNIDKYKKIRESCSIITRALKEKKRHLEGYISDMGYKKMELEGKKNEIFEIDRKVVELSPKIEELKSIIAARKASLESIESQIIELNSLKRELSVAEAGIIHKAEQNNHLNDEIKKLEAQIMSLQKELDGKKPDETPSVKAGIESKEKEIDDAEISLRNISRKIRETEVKIEQCNETIRKISQVDICPVCEQKVDDLHKSEISSREAAKLDVLLKQIRYLNEEDGNIAQVKMRLRKELNDLAKELNYAGILKIKFESLSEKIMLKESKIVMKESIKKEIAGLNSRKAELSQKIPMYAESEQKYKSMKKEIDSLLPQERFLELEKNKYETEREAGRRAVLALEKEINEKQKAKDKLAYLSGLSQWIDELFVKLMSTMEKHIMVNIHFQFNELFRNWFDVLIEDENISVNVDEEFTPFIEQDGYETYIESLSGGERTSVALSYRLALNKVINDIVATIKTKDIIILDEPTDGFSTEQLDKMRDILDQLNMKQVIIVSHEGKIESFVQNVVRVQKNENLSMVV
ncbi:SMC family ATPase [Candidatus Woesearchaeota archaeon]|nr:SMC family ATPase [Candidatus Woesearchaeota archaeon]